VEPENTPAKTQTTETQEALAVSARVTLEYIRLQQSSCRLDCLPPKGRLSFQMSHEAEAKRGEKSTSLTVVAKFHLDASPEGSDNQIFARIDATFSIVYSLSTFEGLTEGGIKRFANMNGIYNAWPYWREFVQSTVTRMGLPALTIPVFRIAGPTKDAKSAPAKKQTSRTESPATKKRTRKTK
jgi:hypothetical protein